MKRSHPIVRWLAAGMVVSTAGYAILVGLARARFGHVTRAADHAELDPLLDRFMPVYEVVERHHVRVQAPVNFTFAAAANMDLAHSAVVRTIFRLRAWWMRSGPAPVPAQAHGFVARMRALGWGVLAEIPGREIVMGGVTQPWQPNPVFTALAPEEFAAFQEPNYVKIIFTVRADPIDASHSIFRSETRAVTTDRAAREKFRRYWSFVSPGVSLIRWMALGPVKAEAEREARRARESRRVASLR